MDVWTEEIRVRGRMPRNITIRLTDFGPVVTELVPNRRAGDAGMCVEISIDKACMVCLIPPDPWEIPVWAYDYLAICINPGNSTLTKLIISKTPDDGEAIELDPSTELSPGKWACLKVPVEDLGWVFGSRLESLKLTATGSGTIYLDSVSLGVTEAFAQTIGALLALSLSSRRYARSGRRHLGHAWSFPVPRCLERT